MRVEGEITSGLHAGAVEALATSRSSLPINGRNGDTSIGYLGRAALKERAMSHDA
jgi:hypothetical protein